MWCDPNSGGYGVGTVSTADSTDAAAIRPSLADPAAFAARTGVDEWATPDETALAERADARQARAALAAALAAAQGGQS